MRLVVNVNLHTLHCITPTDPSGEDEPYMWIYFVRADGETIRQNTVTSTRLTSNVQVSSGAGRPGNLLVESVESGANIRIPGDVGAHSSEMRPIVLRFNQANTNFRFFLPGVMFVVAVLIDEEAVPRDAMEGAHADVKKLLRQRLDDFFNGLDLQPLILQTISDGNTDGAVQTMTNMVNTFIGNRDSGLVKELIDAAIQSAQIAVMSSWNPITHFTSALDPDEPVGDARVQIREDQFVANNLSQNAGQDIRQSPGGLGGAWYVLHGGVGGELKFTQADAVIRVQAAEPVVGGSAEHRFTEPKLCIPEGAIVQWIRYHHRQTYDVSIEYPFTTFRYKLDGQILEGNDGTATISKEVAIPEFDPTTYEFVRYRQETRDVQVAFARMRLPNEPQIAHITFTNEPDDGSYYLTLDIEAVLNDGRAIFAGQHMIEFNGQTIELPPEFTEGIERCLEPLTSNRFSKSIRVGPKELWGPYGRQQRYEQIVRAIDTFASVRGQDAAVTDAVKNAIAARLKIQR